MGSLIRRENGFYYGIFPQNGKRVWRSTHVRSLDEAKEVFVELSKEYVSYKRMTILEFRIHLLNVLNGTLAPATVDLYDQALRKMAELIGNRLLRSITVYQVEEFKAKRIKQVSSTKVNMDFRTLKAAFNRAVSFGFMESNPFLRTKNITIAEREPRFLSQDEFRRLVAVVANIQMRAIMFLAVSTGMRQGEIINLKWEDVHIGAGMIKLVNRKAFVLKSKKKRTVPLNQAAVKVLTGLPRKSEYVFVTRGGNRLCGRSVSRLFKKYVRMANLSDDIHFHSMRHYAEFRTMPSDRLPILMLKGRGVPDSA